MLVLAVARVHDVRVGEPRDELRRADRRMPHDDDVRARTPRASAPCPSATPPCPPTSRRSGATSCRPRDASPRARSSQASASTTRRTGSRPCGRGASGASSPRDRATPRATGRCRGRARRRRARGPRSRGDVAAEVRAAAAQPSAASSGSPTRKIAVALVELDELDLDPLAAPGREVLADVVGPDRKLAVAAVDEDRELHASRPPELEERVDRGADRPPRVQHVVHEDDGHPLDRERDARRAHDRLASGRATAVAHVHVVAVERDVERADRKLRPAPLLDQPAQPRREWRAARLDPDERDPRRARRRSRRCAR